MEENKRKLEAFKESIEGFKKLSFEEAQDLYKEVLEEENPNKREAKRQELICGLLYKVYKHIENSDLIRFLGPTYDMDDIINGFVECFIKYLDEGFLLNEPSACSIFNEGFYSLAFKSITSEDMGIYDVLGIDIDVFTDLFLEFSRLKNINASATFAELLAGYSGKQIEKYREQVAAGGFKLNIDMIYELFETIYQSITISEGECINISRTKVKKLAYLLLKNGINSLNAQVDRVAYTDMDETINHRLFCDEAWNIVKKSKKITPKQLKLLEMYYIEGIKIKELGEYYGVTGSAVRQSRKSILKNLNTSYALRKYVRATSLER